jgi:hypothetical protein
VEHAPRRARDLRRLGNEHVADLLMQAKGMRWLIIGTAAIAGFLASFASKYLPFVEQIVGPCGCQLLGTKQKSSAQSEHCWFWP